MLPWRNRTECRKSELIWFGFSAVKWSIWDSNPIGILKTVYFESFYVYEILQVTMKWPKKLKQKFRKRRKILYIWQNIIGIIFIFRLIAVLSDKTVVSLFLLLILGHRRFGPKFLIVVLVDWQFIFGLNYISLVPVTYLHISD